MIDSQFPIPSYVGGASQFFPPSLELEHSRRLLMDLDRRESSLLSTAWLCLLAAGTVAAWRFGGVKAIDQIWVVTLLAGSALFLFLTTAFGRIELPSVPRIAWPILLAVGMGLLQLLPLSGSLHESLSPQGLDWWSTLSTDESVAEAAYPLSLYPGSTRLSLATLAFGCAAYLLASAVQRRQRLLLWLLVAATANGAALALFGIVQLLSFNGKLFWTIPLTQGGDPFASFVNHNHAAGYLNLCLATSIGLFIYVTNRESHLYSDVKTNGNGNGWHDSNSSPRWQVFFSAAACILIAAAVICTASRGGAIAAVASFGFAVLVDGRLRALKSSRWLLWSIVPIGSLIAVWLGRGLYLHSRFQEMWTPGGLPINSRLTHWADSLRGSLDFLLTGTGLGTYRFVYRPYESSFVDGWYYHAENYYVEALLEGGIPGVLLLLAALFFSYRALRRRRSDTDSISLAMSVAGLFAWTSQAVHGLFDFGLYMPSNAILLGAIVGSAGLSRSRSNTSNRIPWILLQSSLIAWCCWSFFEISDQAEFEQRQKAFSTLSEQADKTDIEHQLPLTTSNREFAEDQFLSSNVALFAYQQLAFQQLRQELPAQDESFLWRLSSPRVLHQRAHQLQAEGDEFNIDSLTDDAKIQDHLRTAYDRLLLARQQCPLLPNVHLGLARLGILFGEADAEQNRIADALLLGSFLPDTLFQAGLLDLQAGRAESGFERWRRCLLISSRYIDQIMQISASVISTQELFDSVLPRSPERLIQVADSYFSTDESASNRAKLAQMAADALGEGSELSRQQREALNGHIQRLRGNAVKAIDHLTVAVALNPRDAFSRYELAKLLRDTRQLGEALHHATILHKLAPGPKKHRHLLEEVRKTMQDALRRP